MCGKPVKDSQMKEMYQRYQDILRSNSWVGISENIFTLGYGGRRGSDIIEQLKDLQVNLILGVGYPLNDWCHEFEFDYLQNRFPNYCHIFELSNRTFSLRPEIYKETLWPTGYWEESYRKMGYFPINYEKGMDKFRNLIFKAKDILLLCSERDASRCHRSLLASYIQNVKGGRIINL